MHNLYMTDYGDVRVSPDEASILSLAAKFRAARRPDDLSEYGKRVMAKAAAIQAACRRFAEFNSGK